MDFAPRSQPLALRYFAELEIDARQVDEQVKQGWLRQLSDDAYLLRGDQPDIDGTIAYLQTYTSTLHVGDGSGVAPDDPSSALPRPD
jgi:hypothetical protein